MAELNVQIGADSKRLEKSLKEVDKLIKETNAQLQSLERELKSTEVTSVKTSSAIDRLNKEFKDGTISEQTYTKNLSRLTNLQEGLSKKSTRLSNDMTKLNRSVKTLGGSGGSMHQAQKSTVSGTAAMTSFSRVVQDAPFGIMGVANNITNLTEQFGHLKTKTGSSSGALKAMLKDLKGFGGISLGISLVTSLLVIFGDKIFATKDKVGELRKEQEELTKSLDDYIFGLEAVNKAQLKGTQTAQKDLVNLRLLKKQLDNTNLSQSERIAAVNELKRRYPEYLKNLTQEELLSGKLDTVYKQLTTSILQRAKATAATNAIVKNSETLLTLESQLAAEKVKLTKLENDYNKAVATTTRNERTGVNTSVEGAKIRRDAQIKAVNDIQGAIQNLELTNIDLETNIGDVIIPPDAPQRLRQKLEPLKTTLGEFSKGIVGISQFLKQPENAITIQTDTSAIARMKEELQLLNDFSKNLVESSLVQTFGDLGNMIGQALATGGNVMAAAVGAIIQGLSGLLKAMGDKLIQMGTAAVLAGTVVKLFGTIKGIGAGLAAIAGGTLLNAVSGGLGGGRSNTGNASNIGGDVAGATTSNFGSSRRFTSSGGGSNTFSDVVFRIQGTELVGVLSNTLERNRALGGNLSLTT